MAEEMGLPFLGRLPLDPRIGMPFMWPLDHQMLLVNKTYL